MPMIAGRLQVYVCHDGSLEVYVDGKDIKKFLHIDASSMWFDFGQASLTVATHPGAETETRPKDFRKSMTFIFGVDPDTIEKEGWAFEDDYCELPF